MPLNAATPQPDPPCGGDAFVPYSPEHEECRCINCVHYKCKIGKKPGGTCLGTEGYRWMEVARP